MAIKLEMLRVFVAVAEAGNLSDAAKALGRSPSAVSMMLKQFEDHLGQPLFSSDRKAQLSPTGMFALDKASRELHHFDATVRALQNFSNARLGRVCVAAVPSVASTILPQAIARFLEDAPEVQIELRDMDSISVVRELMQGRVDFGIASVPANLQSLRSRELIADRFGMICHSRHPLALAKGPVAWHTLSAHRFIANDLAGQIDVPVFRDIHEKATLSVVNITSLLAMIRAGLGITVLPEMTIRSGDHPDLVFRPLIEPERHRRIQILHKTDKPPSPAASELERQIFAAAAQLRAPSD